MNVNQIQPSFNVPDIGGEDHVIEDIDLDEDIEELDESESSSLRDDKKAKRKKRSNKPRSLALSQREIALKDLAWETASKASLRRSVKYKEKIQKRLADDMKQNMQEFLRKDQQVKVKDSVVLSAAAMTYNEEGLDDWSGKNGLQAQQDGDVTSDDIKSEQLVQDKKRVQLQTDARIRRKDPGSFQKVLQQYIELYSQSVFKEDSRQKDKRFQVQRDLVQKGISPKQLRGIEGRVYSFLRKDLKREFKKSFLDVAMSYEPKKFSGELISKYEYYKAILDESKKKGVFGVGRDTIQDSKESVKFDLKNYVAGALDESLVKVYLEPDSIKELVKVFDKFNHLAGFVGFDTGAYMKQFYQKLDHLGLLPFLPQGVQGVLDTDTLSETPLPLTAQEDQDDQDGSDDSSGDNDQQEKLEDQLRQLYVDQKLDRYPLFSFKVRFKIKRLEKALRALGQTKSIDTVRSQSLKVAHLKFVCMLRSAFEERASLVHWNGPVYRIAQKNIKMALKGLKRLGHSFSKSDIIEIRDQANMAMFTIVKEEYIKLDVYLEARPNDQRLIMKKKGYKGILERLKTESRIHEGIEPKLLRDLSFLSDINIIEAA